MTAAEIRPSADDRIKAALWFAERGFGVFTVWSTDTKGVCHCPKRGACESPGKHPVTSHGFKDATTDPVRIRTLLSAGSEPNYGLLCPEGVFALDVDGEGVDQLAKLEAIHGPLPPTLRTQTAHGSHIFLRWPAELPRPLGQLFGFVTRWGSGKDAGYVIGPRSVHPSGAVYRPTGGTFEIAAVPEGWARAALAPPVTPSGTITIKGSIGPGQVLPGHRHAYLRDQARHLVGVGLSGDALFTAVMDLNSKLSEPKTVDEVRRAIGDAETRFEPDELDVDGTPIVSATADSASGRKIFELAFTTGVGVMAMPDSDVSWAWRDYLAYGAITEIVGPPKAGKTTFVFGLVEAIISGRDYLERATVRGPVVILTEQGHTSLRAVLTRTGLDRHEDVHFAFHRDTRGASWPSIVDASLRQCELVGARFLVVDTLPAFAGLSGETENNSGDALRAMEPLLDATGQGLAILVNRHRRKGGAEDVADEGRGSGAFSGAVDVIVALRRKGGGSRPTIRVLAAASRFDETPEELVVEFTEGRYVSLGTSAAVTAQETRDAVMAVLNEEPQTVDQIVDLTGKGRTLIQNVLMDLIRAGQIGRSGAGKRGSPTAYALVVDEPRDSFRRSLPPKGGGEATAPAESIPAPTGVVA